MYRDNTLIPAEAIRLAALGTLACAPMRYADLAREVRAFASRITGPSLDILGSSIELLRYEGLVAPADEGEDDDDAVLEITETGRRELKELMYANVRGPMDGVSKLVLTLKLRFLHLLEPSERREQVDRILEMCETELARLNDLRGRYDRDPGHLVEWLAHDIGQTEARIAWLRELYERV